MKFVKMQGCGNDYIFIDCFEEEIEKPEELAKRLSNRHFGIGADGLVLIKKSNKADCFMDMYNGDGSRAQMCGNAIRCVAKYLYEEKKIEKTDLFIETLSGIRKLRLMVIDNKVEEIIVNMGKPNFSSHIIPVLSEKNIVSNEPIDILGYHFKMTCVSMGNPHAVVFVDKVKQIPLEKVGIPFEHHLRFPERVNIEFVQIKDKNHIIMRVWERGTGETLACGTGACAAVATGVLNGYLNRKVMVELTGGNLEVNFDEITGEIYLRGNAQLIYRGETM